MQSHQSVPPTNRQDMIFTASKMSPFHQMPKQKSIPASISCIPKDTMEKLCHKADCANTMQSPYQQAPSIEITRSQSMSFSAIMDQHHSPSPKQ
eukprot:3097462-Ditylum_brightwellii.AAC.1